MENPPVKESRSNIWREISFAIVSSSTLQKGVQSNHKTNNLLSSRDSTLSEQTITSGHINISETSPPIKEQTFPPKSLVDFRSPAKSKDLGVTAKYHVDSEESSQNQSNLKSIEYQNFVPRPAHTLEDNNKIKVAVLTNYLDRFHSSKEYLNYGLFRKKRRSIFEKDIDRSDRQPRYVEKTNFVYESPIFFRNPFGESTDKESMTVTESQVYLNKLKREMALSPLKANAAETKTAKDINPCIESCEQKQCNRRLTKLLSKHSITSTEASRKKLFG